LARLTAALAGFRDRARLDAHGGIVSSTHAWSSDLENGKLLEVAAREYDALASHSRSGSSSRATKILIERDWPRTRAMSPRAASATTIR
jgi:hypothetical protein